MAQATTVIVSKRALPGTKEVLIISTFPPHSMWNDLYNRTAL